MRELIDSGRYDSRINFTVVLQPFLREVYLPRLEVRAERHGTIFFLLLFCLVIIVKVFKNVIPTSPFFFKGRPARPLVLLTRLLPSQPESSHPHGSSSLEQHGRILFIRGRFTAFLFWRLIFLERSNDDLHNLSVGASGQQDLYTRLSSWHWFEVSLWGNFIPQCIRDEHYVLLFCVLICFWLFLCQTNPFIRTAANSNYTFPGPPPTPDPVTVGPSLCLWNGNCYFHKTSWRLKRVSVIL